MQENPSPRVAIVYDHLLTKFGGAEFVLDSLSLAFPQAVLLTTVHDSKNGYQSKLPVRTSALQHALPIMRHREILDLLTPLTLENLDLREFDLIISVTSSAAKGIITTPEQLHVCYLLTPTRYLYHAAEEARLQHPLFSQFIFGKLAQLSLRYLRWWDQVAISRPDKIIAISKLVASRIETSYGKKVDSIIYPPVPLVSISQAEKKAVLSSSPYLLCVTRLMPYKRIDLAITAALKTDKLLLLAGTGRELSKLLKVAGEHSSVRKIGQSITDAVSTALQEDKNIVFLGHCSETEKTALFSGCEAVIMPGVEDFGITAVEATAYGKPAILSAQSGAAELLLDGVHAIHVSDQTEDGYVAAIKKIKKVAFNPRILKENASLYGQTEFVRKFHNFCFAILKETSTIVR